MIFNMVDYGLFTATVVVTCPSGTTSCTLKHSDGTTIEATSHTGTTYTFTVTKAGTWTATASNGSKTSTYSFGVKERGSSASYTVPDYSGGGDDPTPSTYSKVLLIATAPTAGNLFLAPKGGDVIYYVMGVNELRYTVDAPGWYVITGSAVYPLEFYVPDTSATHYEALAN